MALGCFVVAAHVLQTFVLNGFGWVQFFGGRLSPLNHLVAVGFYLLQLTVVLTLKVYATDPVEVQQVITLPPGFGTVLARKGAYEVPLAWERIAYIQAFGNYTRAWVDGESYLLSFGIGSLPGQAFATGFLRIHRSYCLNPEHLRGIVREGRNYRVELTDGTRLPIGRTYLPTIKAWRR